MESKKILYDSDEAAKYMTGISGWVDSGGRFFGDDEHMARWSGCTHKPCDACREIIEIRSYCRKCHNKKQLDKFNAMPIKEWDNETPLYSQSTDQYFFDYDQLSEYCDDTGESFNSLNLIICEPIKYSFLDEDYYCDDLPEDGEIPEELNKAIDALNSVIAKLPPAAWEPGKFRAIITQPTKADT